QPRAEPAPGEREGSALPRGVMHGLDANLQAHDLPMAFEPSEFLRPVVGLVTNGFSPTHECAGAATVTASRATASRAGEAGDGAKRPWAGGKQPRIRGHALQHKQGAPADFLVGEGGGPLVAGLVPAQPPRVTFEVVDGPPGLEPLAVAEGVK